MAFVIDTFGRGQNQRRKKNRKEIIIIIIFYDVPTTRVIREISISANCRLIVRVHPPPRRPSRDPPATAIHVAVAAAADRPRANNLVRCKTHTLTLRKVLSRFLGLQRKPFRSRFASRNKY